MAIWLAFLSTIRPKPLAPAGAAIGSVRSFAATLEVHGPERAAKMLEHLAMEVRGQSPEHLDSVIEEAYERSARRPRGR